MDAFRETDIIAWDISDLKPADVQVFHAFKLTNERPKHSRVRRMPPRYKELVRKQVGEMLKAGIIVP